MPVVVVATLIAKPESVDAVRTACTQAIGAVHSEPGCQLYSLHEADGTFVFVEQWADEDRDRYDEGVLNDVLRRIDDHYDDLVAGWRPLAQAFAALP